MNVDIETLESHALPCFLADTEKIRDTMKRMSLEELQVLWKCNDNLAKQNYERIQQMHLQEQLTPAILSYEGIQYKYMAPTVFEESMLQYIQDHLRIISGFYGVLRPMDGVTPYRLEMQAKLPMEQSKNLYDYWDRRIYDEIVGEIMHQETKQNRGDSNATLGESNAASGETIINLASKEYSICIEKYLRQQDRYITCIFGEIVNDKVVQKGTYAKMARGEMVRFMAEHRIEDVEEIKGFNRLGYHYKKELSTENSFVFIKK